MLTAELAAESPFGKEIKDLGRREGRKEGLHEGLQRGLQQGLQQGLQEGRREEAVQALRTYLRVRFPSIAERPEVDRIAHAADPNEVLERAYRARSAVAVLAVLPAESPFGKEIKDSGRRAGRKQEAVQAPRTNPRVEALSIAERPEMDRIAHAADPNG